MPRKRRVPETLRRQARLRAGGCCEYCLVYDGDVLFVHEPDHIIAEKHGGTTTLGNLAWACASCNRYKGTDLASIDPLTGNIDPLYNPRQQHWSRHFRLNGARIEPLTAGGRATERLLHFNDKRRLNDRLELIKGGRYPPRSRPGR